MVINSQISASEGSTYESSNTAITTHASTNETRDGSMIATREKNNNTDNISPPVNFPVE